MKSPEKIAQEQEQSPAERIAELELQNKNLKEKLVKAMTDTVTGLEIRSGLFEDINEEIQEILTEDELNKLETLTNEDLVEFLDKLINDPKIAKKPLCLMMSDVAYLSLANKSGLEGGDMLLAGISDSARAIGSPEVQLKEDLKEEQKKPLVKFFRHGGDELTAVLRLWPDEANEKLNSFSDKVTKIKAIKDLENNNLSPHIDFGIANLADALVTFKKIIKNPELHDNFPPNSRLKKFENIWLQLAEVEANVKKYQERITLLSKLKIKNPELYDDVIAYLRKGAQNISDIKIDIIIKMTDQNPDSKDGQIKINEHIIKELKGSNINDPQMTIILDNFLQKK